MIGVFDSGIGGYNSLRCLRERFPLLDVAYLADRKNAPYGTKSEEELLDLIDRCIDRLLGFGAERVLIACCTASTVWSKLSGRKKEVSMPIISSVRGALSGGERRVLVIATKRTADSGAFSRVIRESFSNIDVREVAAQDLVAKIEFGARTGDLQSATANEIVKIQGIAAEYDPDSLILGCTHFASVEGIIAEALPGVKIVNPARLGAMEMAYQIELSGMNLRERGRVIYM